MHHIHGMLLIYNGLFHSTFTIIKFEPKRNNNFRTISNYILLNFNLNMKKNSIK